MTINVERGPLPLFLRGRFKPWSIDAGHSKILLRGFLADFESEDPPRIFDVLFQDVSRISIADRYEDLRVVIAEEGELRLEEGRVGGRWRDSKMFLLNSSRANDYVVAGVMFWAEVAISVNGKSPLMEENPVAGSVRGAVYKV